MNFEAVDIVILGHLAKDIIDIDGKSYESLGGTVYYGGIAGSHMGLKIAIITKLNEADYPLLNIFKKNGVAYYVSTSKETSGLKNIISSKNMESREYKPIGFAGLFSKEEIPLFNPPPKFFVIGPITAGEIDLELLDYLKNKYTNLCLDIQGFVRFSDNGKVFYSSISLEEKKKILSNVNVLKIDQTEAKVLTNHQDIKEAAKELAEFGVNEILITHEKGVSVFTSDVLLTFPWKNRKIVGRTGRGDTAFISYLGSRLTKNPEDSLKFATALTSLKLESTGPFDRPLYQVEELIKKEY
ncbi:MAG: PfkB family carbohydrate kinase [Candidatus Thorarchaeota archaeon]